MTDATKAQIDAIIRAEQDQMRSLLVGLQWLEGANQKQDEPPGATNTTAAQQQGH